MKKSKTVQEIKSMSYTDFVGLVNQWNVPPGAYNTLTSWMHFGKINKKSNILEVACTTGFSCREIALMTGCKATGIDISKASIEAAIKNKDAYARESNLLYIAMNAMDYTSEEKFSHIIVGAALRFFPEPQSAIEHIVKLLEPGGMILSTEFYCEKSIPKELVGQALRVFDITVTEQGYKEVMSVYGNLTLLHEERHEIMQETSTELDHYCDSTISRFSQDNPQYSDEELAVMRSRLMRIRDMSNRLRPYQRYNVLVHKADPRYYPHRYTELF